MTLCGKTDHSAVTVHIPGTSFITKTDTNGTFIIPNVSEDKYTVLFSKEGYEKYLQADVLVLPKRITTLTNIILKKPAFLRGIVNVNDNGMTNAKRENKEKLRIKGEMNKLHIPEITISVALFALFAIGTICIFLGETLFTTLKMALIVFIVFMILGFFTEFMTNQFKKGRVSFSRNQHRQRR